MIYRYVPVIRCYCQDCYAPVLAWWVIRRVELNEPIHTVPLCQRHLDMWLDNADDDPTMEPAQLVFDRAAS